MVKCCLCDITLEECEYVDHLKKSHMKRCFGNFDCPNVGCDLRFHKLRKLKYHLSNNICSHSSNNNDIFENQVQESFPVMNADLTIQDSVPIENNISMNDISNENNQEPCEIPEENSNSNLEFDLFSRNNLIQDMVLQIALKLHAKPNLTRSDVYFIQKLIIEYVLQNLLTLIINQTSGSIVRIVEKFIESFKNIDNDHGLDKILSERKLAENFHSGGFEFTISKEVGIMFKKGCTFLNEIVTTGMLLPIKFQIQSFLSKSTRFSEIMQNINSFSLLTENISHYFQGSTWTKIRACFPEDQIVIPIGLYTDGVEINNAVGKHKESTDNLYYFYPGLIDPFHKDNIHVAAILKSKDIKSYGSGRCLSSLVRELLKLALDGINIQHNGEILNIKVVLGQIIGDNLALNAILEYILGFRGNFYCRICKMSRSEAEIFCEEVISKLRTKENYENDLQLNDSSATGIEQDCVFNVLKYFHCTYNYSLDLMHDFFEGIIKYDVCQVILNFIERKLITIDELNERISNFTYGSEESRYIPNILNIRKLKENNLNMTAKEAWQFIYLLPLLIGDIVEDNDEVWTLIKTLLELLELCLSSSFNNAKLTLLSSLVKRHHTIYQKYFGALKPKMHLITHLSTSIRAMGPLRSYMCFRMEAKHRFFKIYGHCTPNRINISKTFAKKYILHFANILIENKSYLELSTEKEVISEFPQLITPKHKCYLQIIYRGTDYVKGMFLPLLENGTFYLYEILELTILENNINVICRKTAYLSYSNHLISYKLNRISNQEINIINFFKFQSVPIYIYKTKDKTEYIRPKVFFQKI